MALLCCIGMVGGSFAASPDANPDAAKLTSGHMNSSQITGLTRSNM